MSKVVPHTRDCASHWDGECDCAPKTREELQQQIEWLGGCHRRSLKAVTRLERERNEARELAGWLMYHPWSPISFRERWEKDYPWLKETTDADHER